MLTLQKTFTYKGNVNTSVLRQLTMAFEIPVFEYFETGEKGGTTVDRRAGTTQWVNVPQAIDAADYRVDIGSEFAVGTDKATLALARKYYTEVRQEHRLEGLRVRVAVHYLTLDGATISGEQIEFIHYPKLDLRQVFDRTRTNLRSAPDVARSTFIAVNQRAFEGLLGQLAQAGITMDEFLLLDAISYLTNVAGSEPELQKLSGDLSKRLTSLLETDAVDNGALVIELITKSFATLYDFPLQVEAIKGLTIAGTFTITAPANEAVSADDFKLYHLTAEYTLNGSNDLQLLRYPFGDNLRIDDGTVSFAFPEGALRNSVAAPVVVTVKDFDGAISWSMAYKPDAEELAALQIEVPLQTPVTLDPGDKVDVTDKAKKLRGQVLEFSKECPLKGLTVVIQAKGDGDTVWRIVGAATTDSAGRFSLPYPFGIYTEAQAIVSAAPDAPAAIRVIAVHDVNQTISDDFLYLLIKEMKCPKHDGDVDCDCHDTGKSSRLPDQAELIGSKEFTQDLGGSCVNLSTPNRTLSEFNYQAVVRTSDPDVSNYVLQRIETGVDALDANLAVLLANAGRSLEQFTTTTRTTLAELPPEMANGIMAYSITMALNAAWPHVYAVSQALNASLVTHSVLNSTLHHVQAAAAMVVAIPPDIRSGYSTDFLTKADNLRSLLLAAIDVVGGSARYELTGGIGKRNRKPVDLDNAVAWQDDNAHLSLYQAVTVATGHILHYKSEFRADGYSMGDLIYSLPLAPGQKKQIVVFDASHRLTGAESQILTQGERLAAGIVDERDITSQLGGRIAETLRGSSNANTSGISAGFGTGGQGSGSNGAFGGSGSAVIGVAGGVANANSSASQDSSRDISQFFQEKLRQSIMQNADSYRQLNASVVTTVQEGQQYGVTSEVVANHNHCHALTIMYFEVLRHYAVFQKLSSVEECVFVPLLMTNFTTHNMYKWRDVLAQLLLPMPAETYLQPFGFMPGTNRQHPLLKAFDANERIKTNYANVDYPTGSYDEERIRFIRGSMRLRINLPRPRTRFDRIMSFPLKKSLDVGALSQAAVQFSQDSVAYSVKAATTAGIWTLFNAPPPPPNPSQFEVVAREAVFDAFMSLDANFQTAAPAQCIRINNFKPPASINIGLLGTLIANTTTAVDFFAENEADRRQWTAYATILGYPDVLTMLDAYFKGNLISEWDSIFYNDIAPLLFERMLSRISVSDFATDFTSESKYKGGEQSIRVTCTGSTSKARNQLPEQLVIEIQDTAIRSLQEFVVLNVETLSITYSTAHYNGVLYSGSVNDDLLDRVRLFIPENSEEKRNPRKDDACLVYKLIEHLNSNLEYYNKVLWHNLDPDRRYMLLDGFNIQIYSDRGRPVGLRSLASIVKNELVTVAGNSLVFPVAAGYKVSNAYIVPRNVEDEAVPITLFDHYRPLTPMEPYRMSVPSRGVFAEAVPGTCNACEKIEPERLQDWNRFPNTDEPTSIAPIVTPTPTVTDWKAPFKEFAAPIVSIQNAPSMPSPGAGLAGLSDLMAKSGIFKDVTGLDANQANVIRTYLSNQENAKAFAEMAKEMAMQGHNTANSDKITDQIDAAKTKGAIDSDQTNEATWEHLMQMIKGGTAKSKESEAATEAIKSIPPENIKTVETPGAKVSAKPRPKSGPRLQKFSIGLKSRSTFSAGVQRALNGNITLDVIPSGDLASMMPLSYLIPVIGGVGSQKVSLAAGQYAANVHYAPAQASDLDFLKEPHLESVGVNGSLLIETVFDLMQKDFATDWEIRGTAEGELFEVPEKCKGLSFLLLAEMEQSEALSFDADFGVEAGFTIATNGTVSFDTQGIGEFAKQIAKTLKIKQAGLVAALLSLFTIKASIDDNKKLTISGGNKVKLTFKPAILKRFVLTQIK